MCTYSQPANHSDPAGNSSRPPSPNFCAGPWRDMSGMIGPQGAWASAALGARHLAGCKGEASACGGGACKARPPGAAPHLHVDAFCSVQAASRKRAAGNPWRAAVGVRWLCCAVLYCAVLCWGHRALPCPPDIGCAPWLLRNQPWMIASVVSAVHISLFPLRSVVLHRAGVATSCRLLPLASSLRQRARGCVSTMVQLYNGTGTECVT